MLKIRCMSNSSAPDAELNLLSCRPTCKRICKLPQCQCLENRLKCTNACTLQNCINMYKNDDEKALSPSSDDDTDDDKL